MAHLPSSEPWSEPFRMDIQRLVTTDQPTFHKPLLPTTATSCLTPSNGVLTHGDEWELKTKMIEDSILTRVESCLSLIQQQDGHWFTNGSAKPNGQGLVAPPSPCSLSSDSTWPRSRKKWNRSSRRRAKSPSQIAMPPANTDSDDDEEPVFALKLLQAAEGAGDD